MRAAGTDDCTSGGGDATETGEGDAAGTDDLEQAEATATVDMVNANTRDT